MTMVGLGWCRLPKKVNEWEGGGGDNWSGLRDICDTRKIGRGWRRQLERIERQLSDTRKIGNVHGFTKSRKGMIPEKEYVICIVSQNPEKEDGDDSLEVSSPFSSGS